jgi:hypothetical protein
MGEAYGTYGTQETHVQGFGGKTCGKRNHLVDLGVDWRIILKRIIKKRDRWRAVVNAVMNLRVP